MENLVELLDRTGGIESMKGIKYTNRKQGLVSSKFHAYAGDVDNAV